MAPRCAYRASICTHVKVQVNEWIRKDPLSLSTCLTAQSRAKKLANPTWMFVLEKGGPVIAMLYGTKRVDNIIYAGRINC